MLWKMKVYIVMLLTLSCMTWNWGTIAFRDTAFVRSFTCNSYTPPISGLSSKPMTKASKLVLQTSATNQQHEKACITDELTVNLGDRSYPIYIGQGLVKAGDLLRKHVKSKKVLIVTNTVVGPLYSKYVRQSLESAGVEVFEVVLPDGESYKTMDVLMQIIDKAMDAKLDRKSAMIALGGGVVGDMTGFAAAIYQRGISFIQVPTTLMAMVDSAVGGKTAVNHPKGKNMIGAFYQPDAVIVDTDTLASLPDRELRSGIAEVIKYGLIRDPEFFVWQEKNIDKILCRDQKTLSETVRRSCENKAEVVAADEKEGDVRATLNLGHTFGHAVETGMGYGAWLHGEAVAAGMIMAADMSHRLGWIDKSILDRTEKLIVKAGLPTSLLNSFSEKELGSKEYLQRRKDLTKEKFIDLMAMDKKVANGQLNLVLLQGELGKCVITNKFDTNKLSEVVKDYCEIK